MASLINRLKLGIRRLKNKPDNFFFLGKDKNGNYTYNGKIITAFPVGNEENVRYMTLHDMEEHFVRAKLTDLKYLNGVNINAVYVDDEKWRRIDEYHGRTYFQPMLAEIPNN